MLYSGKHVPPALPATTRVPIAEQGNCKTARGKHSNHYQTGSFVLITEMHPARKADRKGSRHSGHKAIRVVSLDFILQDSLRDESRVAISNLTSIGGVLRFHLPMYRAPFRQLRSSCTALFLEAFRVPMSSGLFLHPHSRV